MLKPRASKALAFEFWVLKNNIMACVCNLIL